MSHRHDALCYDSAEHLLAVAVPFLLGGRAAGEPAVVTLSDCTAGLVRAALPPGADVTFLGDVAVYSRPAAAIRQYRDLLAGLVAGGAGRIRLIGELPRAAFGSGWDWWARYESAVNQAYDDFPLWSMCVYDTRATPPDVLDDVRRTHPFSFLPDGRYTPNPFVEPRLFLRDHRPPAADPLQGGPPVLVLTGPSAAGARAALRAALGRAVPDGLLLGVNEAVTNAHQHGKGSVELRVWRGDGRVVVTVTDEGGGPADPFAGLLPNAGHGLWLSHLFCDHVRLDRGPGGFTVRLTAVDQTGVSGTRTTAPKR